MTKIINMAIIFILVALCFMVRTDIYTNNVQAMTNKEIAYKQALDSAVDDGVHSLVEVDSGNILKINKQSCIINFYQSLYSNFGILTDKGLQEQLKVYVPVILITTDDGYYIQFNDLYNMNGEDIIQLTWTDKRPYAYEDDKLIYSFTLSSYIKLYDKNTGEYREGKYQEMASLYPGNEILNSHSRFDEVRRNTIVNNIKDDMKYYINQNNRIAKHYGITYNFALPYIQQEDWYRTIDDIGMLVVFQGYPYGVGTDDVFNQYSFSGARIRKSNVYYITSGGDGKTYYHRDDCDLITEKTHPYFSKKDAALEGAYPCLECNP